MTEEELSFVKSALQQALECLPENALVGFVSFGTQVQVHEHSDVSRFLLPAPEGAYIIHSLLEELETDQWPVAPGNRSLRCTGVALSVAASLLGA